MHLEDTIVALSSAAGVGARAVVRLSGARAWDLVATIFSPEAAFEPGRRRCYAGNIRLPDLASPLPADAYYWPNC
jgi:tRNA U34 5-carboxymethylaminomethyl modifying GTPase MnmE/TrmE